MKITDIRFGMLRVPLKTPFKTALRTVDVIEDVVISVHTDTGHVGYGEAPATAVITGDTHGSIIEAIHKIIAPRIIGQEISNLNRITRLIQGALEKNSSAKAAVEIAVYDLFAQLYGAPLYKILGGGDPVITTDITISVDYIDKMVADSLAAVERGFESLKIKVGKDSELDVERVKAVYAAVEDRALLCLVQQPVEPHVLERLDLDDDALMRRVGRNQSSKVRRLRHGHGDLLGQLHVIRGLAGGPRSKHLAIGIVERRGDRMPAPQSRPVRGAVALVGFLAARHRWRA